MNFVDAGAPGVTLAVLVTIVVGPDTTSSARFDALAKRLRGVPSEWDSVPVFLGYGR